MFEQLQQVDSEAMRSQLEVCTWPHSSVLSLSARIAWPSDLGSLHDHACIWNACHTSGTPVLQFVHGAAQGMQLSGIARCLCHTVPSS